MTATAAHPHRAPARSARLGAGRRESLAFRIAMALIVLAVADDAFVHRELGSAASDHLIGGLVPIAVGVVLALAYPRLRPGLRAVACLVCGTFAVVAGTTDGSGTSSSTDWPATT